MINAENRIFVPMKFLKKGCVINKKGSPVPMNQWAIGTLFPPLTRSLS